MSYSLLFRGKRIDNGEYVYGIPLKSKFDCTYMLTIKGGLEADFIFSKYTITDNNDSIAVDSDSITQSLGIKDKNGDLMFYGDKLKIDRTALDKSFKNSKAGELMIERELDELITHVYQDNDILDAKVKTYLKKDGKLLTEREFYQCDENDIKGDDTDYYELSRGLLWIYYIKDFAEIIK